MHTGKGTVVLKSVNPYKTKQHMNECDINIHSYSSMVLPTPLHHIKTNKQTNKKIPKPVVSHPLRTNMQLLPVISIFKLMHRNVWNLNKVMVSFAHFLLKVKTHYSCFVMIINIWCPIFFLQNKHLIDKFTHTEVYHFRTIQVGPIMS